MTWNYCESCKKEKEMKMFKKCEECGTIFWQCPDCGHISPEITGDLIMEAHNKHVQKIG